MADAARPRTSIKTRGHRKRRAAASLIKFHRATQVLAREPSPHPIRVVCMADTHGKRPAVPDGDMLIHAGDLTENGSFTEMQAKLGWLSSLPHKYKILVAGNHDVLLDDAFLAKYPERRYGLAMTRHDLDWGNITYLQNEIVTLQFPVPGDGRARTLTFFGSPWTPRYGVSAFQYHPDNCQHWEGIFTSLSQQPDIIVTHGPPRHHLDRRDFHQAGCPYLALEVRRIRPRLSVFGHIHAAYGRESVLFDAAQNTFEDVLTGWAGWGGVLRLALVVVWAKVASLFNRPRSGDLTTLVNAAIVGGPNNELRNDPVIVEL